MGSVCNYSLSLGFSVTPPPPNRQSSDSAFSSSHTDFSHQSKPSSSAEKVIPAVRGRKRSHESVDDASVSSRSHDEQPTMSKRVKELRKPQKTSRRQSPNASLIESDFEDNSMSHFSAETDSDEPLIHNYKCKYCSKEFTSGISLSNHLRTHTKEKNLGENAVVDIPKKNMGDANDSEDKLSCDKCSKTFKLKIMLKRHQDTCGKTPQVSPQKELLISLEPIDAVYPPKEQSKKLQCEMCTTRFKTIENLEKHMRVIHAAVLKKKRTSVEKKSDGKVCFPCLYCHMTFDDYYVHSGHFAACPKKDDTKPLQCPACDRVLSKKSSYFVHIKSMHFWPRETPYVATPTKETFDCRMCSKKLASQDLLVTHLAAHMSNIEAPDDASR